MGSWPKSNDTHEVFAIAPEINDVFPQHNWSFLTNKGLNAVFHDYCDMAFLANLRYNFFDKKLS